MESTSCFISSVFIKITNSTHASWSLTLTIHRSFTPGLRQLFYKSSNHRFLVHYQTHRSFARFLSCKVGVDISQAYSHSNTEAMSLMHSLSDSFVSFFSFKSSLSSFSSHPCGRPSLLPISFSVYVNHSTLLRVFSISTFPPVCFTTSKVSGQT